MVQHLFSNMLDLKKDKRHSFDQLNEYIKTCDIHNNFRSYQHLVSIITRIKAMNDIRYSIDV